jgi:hypothetical protein
MRRHPWIRVFLVLALLALLVPGAPVFSQDPTPPGLQRLDAATPGGLEVTWDAAGRLPTFLRGAMPAPSGTPKAAALAFIQAYPDVFGTPELAGAEVYTDDQGMTAPVLSGRASLCRRPQLTLERRWPKGRGGAEWTGHGLGPARRHSGP